MTSKRVDVIQNAPVEQRIAVYAPDPTEEQVKGYAERLQGTFEASDRSWRFDIAIAPVVKVYFPSPEYEHTAAFARISS